MGCEMIKTKGHCGLANYKKFCMASCNPCTDTGGKPDGADKPVEGDETPDGPIEAAEAEAKPEIPDSSDDTSSDSPQELKDSQEDSITALEDQLQNSITTANSAINRAKKAEQDSDDASDTAF